MKRLTMIAMLALLLLLAGCTKRDRTLPKIIEMYPTLILDDGGMLPEGCKWDVWGQRIESNKTYSFSPYAKEIPLRLICEGKIEDRKWESCTYTEGNMTRTSEMYIKNGIENCDVFLEDEQ